LAPTRFVSVRSGRSNLLAYEWEEFLLGELYKGLDDGGFVRAFVDRRQDALRFLPRFGFAAEVFDQSDARRDLLADQLAVFDAVVVVPDVPNARGFVDVSSLLPMSLHPLSL
jgi:hypothetical protein